MKTALISAALALSAPLSWAAREQATPQQGLTEAVPQHYVLLGASVWRDGKISSGNVVIRDGRIVAVGGGIPSDAQQIDATGKLILPAFIDAASGFAAPDGPCRAPAANTAPSGRRRGGMAMGAAPSAEDLAAAAHWNPRVCPERDVARDFKFNADAAKALRGQGFASVNSVPSQGNLRGQTALLNLSVRADSTQVLVRPQLMQSVSFDAVMGFGGEYPGSTMGAIALLRQSLYDAQWYRQKSTTIKADNPALAALGGVLDGQRLLLEARNELDFARLAAVGQEFALARPVVIGTGVEYRVLPQIKNLALDYIIPLNFPEAPAVADPDKALDLSQAELEHWQYAAFNPRLMRESGLEFALTARGLKKPEEFIGQLRKAIRYGLTQADAIAALTSTPAKLLGVTGELGTLSAGARASLLIVDPDFLTRDDAKLYEVWSEGERDVRIALEQPPLRGEFTLRYGTIAPVLTVSGKAPALQGKLKDSEGAVSVRESGNDRLLLDLPADDFGLPGSRVQGEIIGRGAQTVGRLMTADGRSLPLSVDWTPSADEPKKDDKAPVIPALPTRWAYPAGEYGRSGLPAVERVLFRNATVWLADLNKPLEATDVLIADGKIVAVGSALSAGDARVVDATGKHLTPGMVDAHSHIAIDGNVNEPSHTITSEVRIADVVNPADINMYRQLAGGVTTAHLLHGSANAIGGQSQVIKLRWGSDAPGMLFAQAPGTIKFALGENPKQANWGDMFSSRYPQTRMGVEQIIEDAFTQAEAYAKRLKADPKNTRRDLRYDALVEILDGKRMVHAHSYRADEILALVRLSQRHDFSVAAFQHVLEGYKVGPELAAAGAGASTFADWWAFKLEVYDAIPQNPMLMVRAGVLTSVNSDSPDLARRLNTEAAKSVRYGLSPSEALALVTLNPAKQLRVDALIGSIEKGKQADIVLWDRQPLSTAARVEQTWIDGRLYFDRGADAQLQQDVISARGALLTAALEAARSDKPSMGDKGGKGQPPRLYDQILGMRQWPAVLAVRRGIYHDGEPVHLCLGHD